MEDIKEYILIYKKRILIISVCFIFLIFSFITYNTKTNKVENKKKDTIYQEKNKEESTKVEEIKCDTIKVEIKGFVKKPNVYELEVGSRVIDLINASGGLLENANTSIINLSKKLFDEMVVIIYSNEEIENYSQIKEKEKVIVENTQKEILKNDSLIEEIIIDKKININTATKEELMTLPKIGEAKAESIIKYREDTKFIEIEDIMNVSGIGNALFEEIKEFIET